MEMLMLIGVAVAIVMAAKSLWGGSPRHCDGEEGTGAGGDPFAAAPFIDTGGSEIGGSDFGPSRSLFDSDDDFDTAGSISGVGIETTDHLSDPSYHWLEGNIYHYDSPSMDDVLPCSGSDWLTNPVCSYMPGNIYHDDFGSSSLTSDNFGCDSSFSDDSWSSTSDDSWSSSSSSDDW